MNHASMCCDGVHVVCNATVEGYCLVSAGTKTCSGEVYRRKDTIKAGDLFFDPQKWKSQLADISRCSPVSVKQE